MVMVMLGGPAAHAAGPLDPPTPSDALSVKRLPDCKAINATRPGATGTVELETASMQLGWVNKPRARIKNDNKNATSEIVAGIPCIDAGAQLQIPFIESRIIGSSTGTSATAGVTVVVSCYTGSAIVQRTFTDQIAANPLAVGQRRYSVWQSASDWNVANCASITRIVVKAVYTFGSAVGQDVFTNWVWMPREWRSSTGGWTPATNENDLIPDGVELPIVCEINATGDDLFELIGSTLAALASWPGCMLIPVGWDRSGRIDDAWNSGSTGQLTAAYENVIPDSIGCGPVGSIPFFGRTIALNTCSADWAPNWGKVVVGWVFVLGSALLIVRRIMWAVGARG